VLGWFFKKKVSPGGVGLSNVGASRRAIPTVQFDSSRITDEVRTDIKATLRTFPQIPDVAFDGIYEAALLGVLRGRDLSVIAAALVACDGIDKRTAAAISIHVANRSTALMENARLLKLGITHAIWHYSGAPCGKPRQDAVHKKLDRKRFLIAEGALIGKRRTWPGMDLECKCVQEAVIPGFD
jgi:hypothetical protein